MLLRGGGVNKGRGRSDMEEPTASLHKQPVESPCVCVCVITSHTGRKCITYSSNKKKIIFDPCTGLSTGCLNVLVVARGN